MFGLSLFGFNFLFIILNISRLFMSLQFRLAFAYISTYGGNLSRKERAYITISGFPKATVQVSSQMSSVRDFCFDLFLVGCWLYFFKEVIYFHCFILFCFYIFAFLDIAFCGIFVQNDFIK